MQRSRRRLDCQSLSLGAARLTRARLPTPRRPPAPPLRRLDFETEEEFDRYKSTREAMPKAAFQYGAKAGKEGGGRRTRDLNRDAARRDKQKSDAQLQKIERIFEEKGFGSAAAFKKDEATPGPGGGAGGGGGGSGDLGMGGPKKRQRI